MTTQEKWYEMAWSLLENNGIYRSCVGGEVVPMLAKYRRMGLTPADAVRRVTDDYFDN
jgi:hypothetical protein